jgi:hypothetical protein
MLGTKRFSPANGSPEMPDLSLLHALHVDALILADGLLLRGRLFYGSRNGVVAGPILAVRVDCMPEGGWAYDGYGGKWHADEAFLGRDNAYAAAASYWEYEANRLRDDAERADQRRYLAEAQGRGGAA